MSSPALSALSTEHSPSPPPALRPFERQSPTLMTRPELHVITEPGHYVFPLHSTANSTLRSAASESSLDSASSPPSSQATYSLASDTDSPTLSQQVHTFSVSHADLPRPAGPVVVCPPPATAHEMEAHCSRRASAPNLRATEEARARARARASLRPLTSESSSEDISAGGEFTSALSARIVSHPYARIFAKRDSPTTKRRKMWNHMLEKSLFTPNELANIGAPQRRTIYIASLEAHIDQLHARLLELQLYPVPFETLEPYHGLNSKTAKSMVAGLYKDASEERTKLLELRRANNALRDRLATHGGTVERPAMTRRHSIDGAMYVYPNLFHGQYDAVLS